MNFRNFYISGMSENDQELKRLRLERMRKIMEQKRQAELQANRRESGRN